MQKWPYSDFTYFNPEHMRSMLQKDDPAQTWEYLTLETVFVPPSENVMFFDHYANRFRSERSELDEYLQKLSADGWKLTMAGPLFTGRSYLFRQVRFRRAAG